MNEGKRGKGGGFGNKCTETNARSAFLTIELCNGLNDALL